jgi:hypothetical protein
MKKVKLSLDALAVESFAVVNEADEQGTVEAHEAPTGKPFTCNTCAATCQTMACPCPVSNGLPSCFC